MKNKGNSQLLTYDVVTVYREMADSWLAEVSKRFPDDWEDPFVTSCWKECDIEWWHGEHTILVSFDEDGSWLLRVWGVNIHDSMSDHDALDFEEVHRSWEWLLKG